MEEWSTNPRSGTSFDLIMSCQVNHTKYRGRRPVPTSVFSQLPQIKNDEIKYPDYKFLSDLNYVSSSVDNEIPHPNYDSSDDDYEIPFPEYKSLNGVNNSNSEPHPIDDHNDVKKYWMEFTIQKKDYTATENESCSAMEAAFAEILKMIVTYNCPNICKNTLWVTLAMVTLSGGSMFQICVWIIFIRRSTIRLKKTVPSENQLPFYNYVNQQPNQVSVSAPIRAPIRKKENTRYDPQGSTSNAAKARRVARLRSLHKNR